MNGAIGFVKAHPVATGASVIAIIAVVFVATSGGGDAGGGGAQVMPDDSAVMAGVQLQALQSANQLAAAETSAKLQLGLAQTAADYEKAKLVANSSDTANALAANVATLGIQSQERVVTHQSSLAAESEAKRIAAELAERESYNATIQRQAELQAFQTQSILNAQLAQAEIAARPKGLFSFLFG